MLPQQPQPQSQQRQRRKKLVFVFSYKSWLDVKAGLRQRRRATPAYIHFTKTKERES